MPDLTPIWPLAKLMLCLLVFIAALILVLEAKERNKFSLRFWLRSKLGLNRKRSIKFLSVRKTIERIL